MDKCHYCGEIKEVRKADILYNSFLSPLWGIDHDHYHFSILGVSYWFNYVCKDCDLALKIKAKMEQERIDKKEIIQKKRWIKERDEILRGRTD